MLRKIFLWSLLVVAIFIPAMTCGAENYPLPVTVLKERVGNWYDAKGNLVLSIGNDYTINGCKVVSVYSIISDQGYFNDFILKCRILEKSGYRDIYFDENINAWIDSNDYHRMIILDGKTALRNTREPHYFESIGGIYIGMDKDKVLKLYGQPSSTHVERMVTTWKYKEGFDVTIVGGVVMTIIIYPDSDRRFDWSGLSARDSFDAFKNKYKHGYTERSYYIGHGEGINYRSNKSVRLTIDA